MAEKESSEKPGSKKKGRPRLEEPSKDICIKVPMSIRRQYFSACKKLGYSTHTIPLHNTIRKIIQRERDERRRDIKDIEGIF